MAITKWDRSGSITSGGTAQQIMPANGNRKGWQIQNTSDTDMYFSEVSLAVAPTSTVPSSQYLAPGALYRETGDDVSRTAVTVVGATTGKTFAAREW